MDNNYNNVKVKRLFENYSSAEAKMMFEDYVRKFNSDNFKESLDEDLGDDNIMGIGIEEDIMEAEEDFDTLLKSLDAEYDPYPDKIDLADVEPEELNEILDWLNNAMENNDEALALNTDEEDEEYEEDEESEDLYYRGLREGDFNLHNYEDDDWY